MSRFLLKTEPSVYSFEDLSREGEAVWDGVTNNLALKNLRSMEFGDECLIYHSGNKKAVVGIAKVSKSPYPDPRKRDEKLSVVSLKPVRKLKRPVLLSELKSCKELENFDLIRLPRLSVMRVPEIVWRLIDKLSREEK